MTGGLIKRFIEWVIHNGGLYALLFTVFAETGLFLGYHFNYNSSCSL